MPLIEKLLYLGLSIGFLCFAILLKLGIVAALEKYGMGFMLLLGAGAIIGVLPIGFLFDRREAQRQQQDDLQ